MNEHRVLKSVRLIKLKAGHQEMTSDMNRTDFGKENIQPSSIPTRKNCIWLSKRFWLMVFLTIGLALYIIRSALNYNGFCIPERRWVSDDEIIRNSIKDVNSYPHVFPDDKGHYDTYRIIPYKNVDEFLSQNPDCCRFGEYIGEGFPAHFWMKISGEFRGTIGIHYKLNYLNTDGKLLQRKHDVYLGFSNCGHRPKIEKFL